MDADTYSEAMNLAIKETERRRNIQIEYNRVHNVEPKTIEKEIKDVITNKVETKKKEKLSRKEQMTMINKVEEEMKKAAKELDFERAMELRDILFELKGAK